MTGDAARRFVLGLAPWIGAVALWSAVRLIGFVNATLIPALHQVATRFTELRSDIREFVMTEYRAEQAQFNPALFSE